MLDSGALTPSRGKKGSSSNLSTGEIFVKSHLQKTNNLLNRNDQCFLEIKYISKKLKEVRFDILTEFERKKKEIKTGVKDMSVFADKAEQIMHIQLITKKMDPFTSCCVASAFPRCNTLIATVSSML